MGHLAVHFVIPGVPFAGIRVAVHSRKLRQDNNFISGTIDALVGAQGSHIPFPLRSRTMRRSLVIPLVLTLASPLASPLAVEQVSAQQNSVTVTGLDGQPVYSAEQLDNLLASIALYPDALLAQVLVAATFPDQIEAAVRFVRANGAAQLDDQAWDVSVKAVAHYPSALNMMADKIDWTTAVGRAYATQSTDVMASVQRLRSMAHSQGNLVSTPQQEVIYEDNNYEIVPAQPRVIYVPVYDPYVIYTRPVFYGGGFGGYWSFSVGFPIGSWLSYDCDWRFRRVYYNGWNVGLYGYGGGGWRARSRPFVNITNVYVNTRYQNVYVNRDVVNRTVNYRNIDRYGSVHRDTHFDSRYDPRDRYAQPRGVGDNGRNVGTRDPRNTPDNRTGDPRNRDRGNDQTYGRTRNDPTPRVQTPIVVPNTPRIIRGDQGQNDSRPMGRRDADVRTSRPEPLPRFEPQSRSVPRYEPPVRNVPRYEPPVRSVPRVDPQPRNIPRFEPQARSMPRNEPQVRSMPRIQPQSRGDARPPQSSPREAHQRGGGSSNGGGGGSRQSGHGRHN